MNSAKKTVFQQLSKRVIHDYGSKHLATCLTQPDLLIISPQGKPMERLGQLSSRNSPLQLIFKFRFSFRALALLHCLERRCCQTATSRNFFLQKEEGKGLGTNMALQLFCVRSINRSAEKTPLGDGKIFRGLGKGQIETIHIFSS